MTWQLPCETTDTVLASIKIPNDEQYPGLPSVGEKPFIYSAITDGIPSMELHRKLDDRHGADSRVLICTLDEVRAFRDALPSVYHRFTEAFPNLGLPQRTHSRARMLQVESEMVARISTISAALIHSRRDFETVVAKARQCCRVSRLLAGVGITSDIDPSSFAPYVDEPARLDDILVAIKQRMIGMYDRTVWPLEPAKSVALEGSLTPAERRKYGFVPYYENALGENWVSGFAYGSSARTDDEEKFDDLDTSMLVTDIAAAYAVLRGTKPHFNARTRSVGNTGKHIGINLFPANTAMFPAYTRSLDDVTEFRENIKVLRGIVPFVDIAPDEERERGFSHAFLKNKTLADSVGRYVRDPSGLLDKKNLFEYLVKNVRFIFKHAMKLETGETLPKETIERLLHERHNIHIPKFRADPEYLRDAIIYARVCSAYLQREYLNNVTFQWRYYTGNAPLLRAA